MIEQGIGSFVNVMMVKRICEFKDDLTFTPFPQIKLNNDFTKCVDVLSALDRKCKELEAGGAKFCLWAIDANAGG